MWQSIGAARAKAPRPKTATTWIPSPTTPLRLIESLGVAPVHYVGLSMGGFVGQRIAARRPELVRTLALLDTSAGPEDPDKIKRYKMLGRIYRVTGVSPLRKAVLPIMFGPAFLADTSRKPVIDEWEHRLKASPRSGVAKAVMGVANRLPIEDEISRIVAPTLVIVGADDVQHRQSSRS